MTGTKEGAKLAVITTKQRRGDDFYRRIGAIGGSRTFEGKGFAGMPAWKRSVAGAKGGSISKRRPRLVRSEENRS